MPAQRTVHEAAATVILGAILLVAIRLMAEWFKRLGDNRAAFLASGVERDFILRTFRHVIRLPLGFFTTRASGALARQIDQSGKQRCPHFHGGRAGSVARCVQVDDHSDHHARREP